MHSNDDNEFPIDVESLLGDAVTQILANEDQAHFLRWMREHLYLYDETPGRQLSSHPKVLAAMALGLARAIWNATPLPGNHFRSLPMAMPGRNDSCPCGSLRKYKQCCANAPELPPLEHDIVWPIVLERLPAKTVDTLLKKQRVPIQALLTIAEDYLDSGQWRKVTKVLEPLFSEPVTKTNELADFALTLLCNAYDELGYRNKKLTLLDRVIAVVPRSTLRSGAWQRLATIRIDSGDEHGAWEAFHHAQRDAPDAPGVGVLEVQLLISTDQLAQAQARAQFWAKRMERLGLDSEASPLGFMKAVAEDPIQAIAGLGMAMAGDAGQRLQSWLDTVKQRPVPAYQLSNDPAPHDGAEAQGVSEAVRSRMLGMGLPEDQIEAVLAKLDESELKPVDDDGSADDEPVDEPIVTMFLHPPAALVALETQWRQVFPLDKPFSIHDQPFDIEDVWDVDEEARWMSFLEAHPDAFDSLDILDDVASACMAHEQYTTKWLDDVLLAPVLQRIETIIQGGLKGVESPRLAWGFLENRPALRNLARLVALRQRNSDVAGARCAMELLLVLNPDDNHGFRTVLINEHLLAGDNREALALADGYPGDINAELAYGRVLALYRLERLADAETALREAIERLPKIVRYLTHKRVRQPKINPERVTVGGDDQAWLYRESMREAWLATPGIIDWLKRHAKRMMGN